MAELFGEDDHEASNLTETEAGVEQQEEILQLSESICLYRNRKLTSQGNVFEGSITSRIYGVRSCAIKFARRNEQNIREAEILTKLANHGHVISIIQSGTYQELFDENIYIALEKCHKLNLRQYLMRRKETIPVYDVNWGLNVIKQIIIGMTFVHENLVIHKDLKPSNILLTENLTTIKIADFGSSQLVKSNNTKVFCKFGYGTMGYRPPEGFGNSYISLKSDIFSLAVVFIFILSNGESPFGSESQMWDYHIKNGVIELPQLLVKNNETTKHLLELMLSTERCRRPTIGEVAEHPSWSGKDKSCMFDYGNSEEVEDSETEAPYSKAEESPDDSREEMDNLNEIYSFVRSMPIRTSIILFEGLSRHLVRYNPSHDQKKEMHDYSYIDSIKEGHFTPVYFDRFIYVLTETRSTYRLLYNNNTAIWERLPDMLEDHGQRPPAVAISGTIFVVSSTRKPASKSVIRYISSDEKWEKLNDKQYMTILSEIVACDNYIYSIGGLREDIPLDKVERLDVNSQTWEDVAPLREARYGVAATEHGGKIFVLGGLNLMEVRSIECFNPETDKWTYSGLLNISRTVSWFRCYSIDGYLYAAAYDDRTIGVYDTESQTWTEIEIFKGENYIEESVVVKEF